LLLVSHPAGSTEVQPPVKIHVSHETNSLDEAKLLPPLSQPTGLAERLLDLQKGSLEERVEKLKKKVLADLVHVPGGTYMMGDFGSLVTEEKLPMTFSRDNKPLHKVTLSSFDISRYKTTFAEYDVFLDVKKKPHLDDDIMPYRNALVPAGSVWQEAKAYCQWLGEVTGRQFDLPTEAQWEYAARSGGKNFLFATNDGNLEWGKNIDDRNQRKLIAPFADQKVVNGNQKHTETYPIGMFPPSPLGLYDMNHDGYEWMNDWYQADYYKSSPEANPDGPPSGKWRVIRSAPIGEPVGYYNHTLTRYAWDPKLADSRPGIPEGYVPSTDPVWSGSFSWRCVVNSDR
jgi:formylglycine-generating enzyme